MKTTSPTEMVGSSFVTPKALRMTGESPNLGSQFTNLDGMMMNTGMKAAALGKALFSGIGEDFPVKGPNGK